jgi:hypothetical protein
MSTIEVVNLWISKKSVKLFQAMQDNATSDAKWLELKGAYDLLEELRHYILMETNPHKREDIERHKK